jgi:hypothetical protein
MYINKLGYEMWIGLYWQNIRSMFHWLSFVNIITKNRITL